MWFKTWQAPKIFGTFEIQKTCTLLTIVLPSEVFVFFACALDVEDATARYIDSLAYVKAIETCKTVML